MKNYQKLIISILIPLFVGFFGSLFTSMSVDTWYVTLNKPSFNPPNWLFSPVWTALFILIGISFYLVWRENFGKKKNYVIGIYSMNLLLNLLWSVFFFGMRNPLLAFIEIILLWIVIISNIIIFYKVKKQAGLLLLPYLIWVSFAAILNYSIFVLN